MATLADSYAETNRDGDLYVPEYDGSEVGQSFTPSVSGGLSSCKFYLKKSSTPTGTAYAKLYAHSGTYGTSSVPTGSALATSGGFDISTLTTSSQLITFTFASPYSVTSGTRYCITLLIPSQTSGKNVLVGCDGSSPSHGGNYFGWFTDVWWADPSDDVCFYVYVDEPASAFHALPLLRVGK